MGLLGAVPAGAGCRSGGASEDVRRGLGRGFRWRVAWAGRETDRCHLQKWCLSRSRCKYRQKRMQLNSNLQKSVQPDSKVTISIKQ